MPFLSRISVPPLRGSYLEHIPIFKRGFELELKTNVSFFVGENGSGKSTLLEAIAEQCGFNLRGGNRNHNPYTGYKARGYETALARSLRLSWTPRRITEGFFMRAESFFNFASYIDELALEDPRLLKAYGGRFLHQQSHGESFLALFNNQFESGIYILDEPEAALSPARILSFISLIHQLEQNGRAQFIIATHSPMLICYPGSTIYHFGQKGISETDYKNSEHFTLTRSFLNDPESFLHHLINHPG